MSESESAVYSAFAAIYDDVMRDVDYESWAHHILALAKSHQLPCRRLLELACGTGTLAASLSEAGVSVVGVDKSEEMLRLAREKLRDRGVSIPLYRAPMENLSDLELDPGFDMVICLYDSLNYVTSEEGVFRAFHEALSLLRPGGGYIFDVTTEYNLLHNFSGYTFAENLEHASYIWENNYDIVNKICSSRVSIFHLNGDAYHKHVEVHRQRVYASSWLKQSLETVGFEVLGMYHNMTQKPPKNDCERIHFVCRKPAG